MTHYRLDGLRIPLNFYDATRRLQIKALILRRNGILIQRRRIDTDQICIPGRPGRSIGEIGGSTWTTVRAYARLDANRLDRGCGEPIIGLSGFERGRMIGTRPADHISASGYERRTNKLDT